MPRLLERLLRIGLAAVIIGLASGCATLPPNAGQDPRDPWEKVNRNVFVFNEGFDANFLKPVAELWAKLPDGIRDCFSNAFFNLRGRRRRSTTRCRASPPRRSRTWADLL
jgi:phospholipid-binding lipoprotein MlaA